MRDAERTVADMSAMVPCKRGRARQRATLSKRGCCKCEGELWSQETLSGDLWANTTQYMQVQGCATADEEPYALCKDPVSRANILEPTGTPRSEGAELGGGCVTVNSGHAGRVCGERFVSDRGGRERGFV